MTDWPARVGRALYLLGLLLGAPATASQFIVDAVPGGLVEIPLAAVDQPRPDAYFGQRRVLVMKFGRRWAGLVGLPLDLVPGGYVIQVDRAGSEDATDYEFTVYPGRGDGQSVVTLPGPPAGAQETDFAWREPLDVELPLTTPVRRPAQRTFGRQRRGPGSGPAYADFVAFHIAGDMVIRSPGAGRVSAMVSDESGTYVWIDHGMSLYSRLGPVTDTTLSATDPVQAGRPIGRLRLDEDDTRRTFYWSVFLNGAAIDPFLISDIGKDTGGGAGDAALSDETR